MLLTFRSTQEETKAQRGFVVPAKAAQPETEERSNTSPSCKAKRPRSLSRDRKKVGPLQSEAGAAKPGEEAAGPAVPPASAVHLLQGSKVQSKTGLHWGSLLADTEGD